MKDVKLQGKGYFIWKIRYCEGGDVEAIADLAAESQYTHAIIKVADGSRTYNLHPETGRDLVVPLVKALREREIEPWGWQYIYGYDPIDEADKAIQRVRQFDLDGFVVDAEAEFKKPGMQRVASQYMNRLSAGLPDTPIALSSYRFPSYHPRIPWDEFLKKSDLAMPQVYWEQSNNPAAQLERCVNEYQTMPYSRPVIPTGSAYRRGEWRTTPEHIIEFMEKALELNLPAANFWEWAHTRRYLPETWEAVSDFYWPVKSEENLLVRYLRALNEHNWKEIAGLYTEQAVHVTNSETIKGREEIARWYRNFFSEVMPNGVFYKTNLIGNGSIRHMTWTAQSSAGEINFGSDTLALEDGLINYHYSFYIIT